MSNDLLNVTGVQVNFAALRGPGMMSYQDAELVKLGKLNKSEAKREYVLGGFISNSADILKQIAELNPKRLTSKRNTATDTYLNFTSKFPPKLIVNGVEVSKEDTFMFPKGSTATANVTLKVDNRGMYTSLHLISVELTNVNIAEASHADIEGDLAKNHIS